MLTNETIENLKRIFIHNLKTLDIEGMGDLLSFLIERKFYEYQAALKYHGNYKGGLLAHSEAVKRLFTSRLKQLRIEYVPVRTQVIAPYLHDLCKLEEYRINSVGISEYNKSPFDNKHGTRSIELAEQFIELTQLEKDLIKYHMGIYQTEIVKGPKNPEYNIHDYKSKTNKEPLLLVFHNCDNEASKYLC